VANQVLCAGGVIADLIARPLAKQPAKGELQLVDEIGVYLGGSAANTAAHLAHMGFEVALAGAIGDDGLGELMRGIARNHNLDIRWLAMKPGVNSAATHVTVDHEGERTFVHAIGALRLLLAGDIPLRLARAEGARVFHLAGYFGLPALEGDDGAAAARLMREASELGFFTSLDSIWDATGRWGKVITPLLPHVDLYCPSLNEAQRITGMEEAEAIIDKLLDFGVRKLVALTMGPRGAHIGSRGGLRLRLPAARVAAIDGTGAGDAFVAGMLAGVLRGDDLLACCSLAAAAGALATTALGGGNGIASLAQVQRLAAEVGAAIRLSEGGEQVSSGTAVML
jgi:sugar/nucleoside kinase (ribokinase family)